MDIFDSIDDKWEYWKSIFWAVVNKHAPMRKVRVRECSSPWITEEVLRIARARNYYRTKHRKTGSIDDWETFKRLRNASKSAIRKAKAEYFEGICHDVARNPSRTWKQLNKVLGRSHTQRVSMLKSTMGGNVFDDGAIAEEFSQFFANCGTCNPNVQWTTNHDGQGQLSIWTEVY